MTLLTVLGIVFIVLKLCSVIAWSWWFVLMPFYGGIVLFLIVLSVGLLAGGRLSYKHTGKR
jgi:hypothetical protein